MSGYSPATAYDFDLAVRIFGRTVEAKLAEQVQKLVPEPKRAPNGQVWTNEPRYTLAELLYDSPDEDGAGENGPVPDVVASLPTALL